MVLSRGQTETINGLDITFDEFDIGSHMEAGVLAIGAVLKVKAVGGKAEILIPVYKVNEEGDTDLEPVELPGTDQKIYLLKINADEGRIMLGITKSDNPDEFESTELLIAGVSRKPLINFVWLGLVLIIIGSGLATYRRIREV